MVDIHALVRPHIRDLKPYSSARDEYTGSEGVFLDANENALGSITERPWNRYPDPYQRTLKAKVAELKGVAPEQLFLGNGSDEPIDLLFRAFCEPKTDHVIINPPTYGMYQVSADIHQVEAKAVPLTTDFQLDVEGITSLWNAQTKMIFICSPNNPTGNEMPYAQVEQVLKNFHGLVVVDEAYIDFSESPSWIQRLEEFPNLVVLQTFSKAWGLAGLRLGMAFASAEILGFLNKIKAPYNLSGLVQETVLEALNHVEKKDEMVAQLLQNKQALEADLKGLPFVQKVYPSDANFFLVKMKDAKAIFNRLIAQKIIVRDRSGVLLCEDGLRITVGTSQENHTLVEALKAL